MTRARLLARGPNCVAWATGRAMGALLPAVAAAAACSIVGTWCDIEGRCSNAPITISGNSSGGCDPEPSHWRLTASVDGTPHWGPLCQGIDATGKLFAQVQLGHTTVRGDIDPACGSILWRNDSAFSVKGWCRIGTHVGGKSCSISPPPSPGPLPVDSVSFRVDSAAKPANFSKAFWDNESWQPSNYPSTRFILQAGDALLKLLPFFQPSSSSTAAGTQVAGITNIVRILGGWGTSSWCGPKNGDAWNPTQTQQCDAYDLAFRDNVTGALRYRWHLLHERVGPVVAAGSTPEIGLGNVPYAFVQHSSQATYGQCQPPDDLGEWVVFIEAFVQELVKEYGASAVSGWRFRIGTEENAWDGKIGIAHLCWHNVTEFLELYDHTAAAVLRALPTAQLGPGNFGAMGPAAEDPHLSYENDSIATAFVQHWATGTNYATGKVGSPVGWLGASAYFSEFGGSGAQFSPAVCLNLLATIQYFKTLGGDAWANIPLEFM